MATIKSNCQKMTNEWCFYLRAKTEDKKLGNCHFTPLLSRMESDPPNLFLFLFLPSSCPSSLSSFSPLSLRLSFPSFLSFSLLQIGKHPLNQKNILKHTTEQSVRRPTGSSQQAELHNKEVPSESNHRYRYRL